MPALPVSLIEPIWDQFAVLLPERSTVDPTHPLRCHRRRIPERVVFDHGENGLVHTERLTLWNKGGLARNARVQILPMLTISWYASEHADVRTRYASYNLTSYYGPDGITIGTFHEGMIVEWGSHNNANNVLGIKGSLEEEHDAIDPIVNVDEYIAITYIDFKGIQRREFYSVDLWWGADETEGHPQDWILVSKLSPSH